MTENEWKIPDVRFEAMINIARERISCETCEKYSQVICLEKDGRTETLFLEDAIRIDVEKAEAFLDSFPDPTRILCLWANNLPDIPSVRMRGLLFETVKNLSDLQILLVSKDGYFVKTFGDIFGETVTV